jgi:hypothetical protein
MTCRTPSEHNKTRSKPNAVTELNSWSKVNSWSKLNPQSKKVAGKDTQKLRALCEEYSDIFDTAVRAESTDIPPKSIKIDETKWKSNKHRLPPRTHSVEKHSQIRQQCDQLLELGVVRHSTASEWSQVHMVP